MNHEFEDDLNDDLLCGYDYISDGVCGKYVECYRLGTNVER
jgi:hypothetical protein